MTEDKLKGIRGAARWYTGRFLGLKSAGEMASRVGRGGGGDGKRKKGKVKQKQKKKKKKKKKKEAEEEEEEEEKKRSNSCIYRGRWMKK